MTDSEEDAAEDQAETQTMLLEGMEERIRLMEETLSAMRALLAASQASKPNIHVAAPQVTVEGAPRVKSFTHVRDEQGCIKESRVNY